ncbi:MAG: hypothetical protein JSR17_07950 [Proteobacteria bacterium]|nr:hypothetical protein [Pseudomonadota bacterium]
MLNGVINNRENARFAAGYTWCLGGYQIGRDLGQGLLNFLPQGFLGLFFEIERGSKLFDLPKALNKLVGPLLGGVFGTFALIPALIEGMIFKRPYKKQNNEWTTNLVSQYGVRLLWGALGISALWTIVIAAGYLATPLNMALTLPLAASYALVALTGVGNMLANLFGSMVQLYIYRTKDIEWPYVLKAMVNIKLEKADEVKEPLNNEFIFEIKRMQSLYDGAYAAFIQQHSTPPTFAQIEQMGVLTESDLQVDQSAFLTLLTTNKKYQSNVAKLAAIDERHQTFDTKYKAKI